MKILAIRGQNLASFEGEFEIDFTVEPLKSTGIFAITGQTGAGKSTILDALCLALFDNSPRFSKAEHLKQEELEALEDKVSPHHCGNILRRGTGYGYAEVDFVALNGDKYRSKWVVKRSRSKSDGKLQSTSIALTNISNNTEEGDSKTERLNRITELIGLSFDQFTRAVLLAQGEFANFLKAKPNEKAELLEKLTGTEVYSEISKLIYQKSKEAESALDRIKIRIGDLHLLSEEELLLLTEERKEIEKLTKPLKELIPLIEKKLEWISNNTKLVDEKISCEEELNTIKQEIEKAQDRFVRLALIDKCQEIRETYIELRNIKSQLKTVLIAINENSDQLAVLRKEEAKTKFDFENSSQELAKINKIIEDLVPEIDQAKSLDIQIDTISGQLAEKTNSFVEDQKRLKNTQATIDELENKLKSSQNDSQNIEKWLLSNSHYGLISSSKDHINSIIENLENNADQKDNSNKKLKASLLLLEQNKARLKESEDEYERLNALIPSEVIVLRRKLITGEPCPVCGSEHHPYLQIEQEDEIAGQELESEKEKVKESIEFCKQNIQNNQSAIAVHKASFETFSEQYDKSFTELSSNLSQLSGWEDLLKNNSLRHRINEISGEWEKKTSVNKDLLQKINDYTIQIGENEKNLKDHTSQFESSEKSLKQITEQLSQQQEYRAKLLEGRPVNEVEENLLSQKREKSAKYEKLRAKKDTAEKEISRLEGTLSQQQKDKKNKELSVTKLHSKVEKWLSAQDGLDEETFKVLMSKTSDWINDERQYLNGLTEKRVIINATLKERNAKIIEHKNSLNRPTGEETESDLKILLKEKKEQEESARVRSIEIDVALSTHEQNNKQREELNKELEEKTIVNDNWAKLNELIGSANGAKFKTIAQGYTMDVLLAYTNKHLEDLSKRYKIEKIPDTLSLRVIDNDMFGEVRTVHSLSGGESFLISLALALGLSSLSSNRMKIESLFIDEGFGALDIETLSVAMDALDSLQSQGRKIGVISHVEEMKERISTQIQVVKRANGKSIIEIRSN